MDLIEAFLNDDVASSETRRAYRADLHRFFDQKEVQESAAQSVDADDVRAFVRGLQQKNESVSTQRRRLAALRRFFDWLVQRTTLPHNPARAPQIRPLTPTTTSSDSSTLTKDEVERLLAEAGEAPRSGLRDQALILTIVYAALRRSEIAGLEVEDLRPLGRYWVLDVRSTADGGYVRVPEIVVDALDRVQERYDISKGCFWRSLSNRNRGAPMSPDAIYKVIRRIAKRADLGPVSIDTLRRTGLQLALQGGADVPQVRTHGRFNNASSAARLHESEERSGALGESAVEHIELDVSAVLTNA